MSKELIELNAKVYMDVLKKDLETEVQRLMDSDAIDFNVDGVKSYGIHKTVYKVALENVARWINGYDGESEKDYEDLKNV